MAWGEVREGKYQMSDSFTNIAVRLSQTMPMSWRWAPGYYKLTAKMKGVGVRDEQPTGWITEKLGPLKPAHISTVQSSHVLFPSKMFLPIFLTMGHSFQILRRHGIMAKSHVESG